MANDLAPPSDPIAAIPRRKNDPLENTCTEPWLRFFNELLKLAKLVLNATRRAGGEDHELQTASIGPSNLAPGDATTGLYSLQWWVEITTPAAVSSSLQVKVDWVTGGGPKTFIGVAQTGNTLADYISETVPAFYADLNYPITYEIIYASNPPADCVYSVDIQLSSLYV